MKSKFFVFCFLFLIVGVMSVFAHTEDLNVSACVAGGCSVAGYNSNDTSSVGSSLNKNAEDTLTMTDTSASLTDAINSVVFHFKWTNYVNLDGDWKVELRDSSDILLGTCSWTHTQSDLAENKYETYDATSCTTWSKSVLDGVKIYILNGDGGAPVTGDITYVDLVVASAVGAPSWVVDLNDSPDPVDLNNNINYTGTGDDGVGNNYMLVVCDSVGITAGYPGTCSVGLLCNSSETLNGTVAWCVYNATTSGDLSAYGYLCGNNSECGDYTSTSTTVNPVFGTLNVSWLYPLADLEVGQYNTFWMNATVSCDGVSDAECGTVYAYARYNGSSSVPDTDINVTSGANPFYIVNNTDFWFNESYGFRREIDCSNLDNDVPIMVNGTAGLSINGKQQFIWTVCKGQNTYLYYNAYDDYMVANESSRIAFEVEKGNMTSYDKISLWNNSYFGVWHLTDTYDSLGTTNLTEQNSIVENQDCIIGECYEFFGSNPGYLTGSLSWSPGTGNLSMSMWYYLNQTPVVGENILVDTHGTVNWWDNRVWFSTPVDSNMSGGTNDATDTRNIVYSNTLVNDSVWHLVTLTRNSSNLSIYIDGEYKNSMTDTHSIADTGTFTIGRTAYNNYDPASRVGTGIVDEVRVSNSVLSASVINQTYQNGFGVSGFGNVLGEEMNANNPVSTGSSLLKGEVWSVGWLINYTGTSSYYIDVLFNSSYGNSNVPDNDTSNWKISLVSASAVSFSIGYPSSGCSENYGCTTSSCTQCTYPHFNTTSGTISNLEPNGQNSTVSFWVFSNDGDVEIDINMTLNQSLPAEIVFKVDTDNNPTGATTITTTQQSICPNLATLATCNVWGWTDYSSRTDYGLNINREVRLNATDST